MIITFSTPIEIQTLQVNKTTRHLTSYVLIYVQNKTVPIVLFFSKNQEPKWQDGIFDHIHNSSETERVPIRNDD